jgi:ectoine hydroxylase-related dioxygenase (phytanoyl-CoA dioxygenase family)
MRLTPQQLAFYQAFGFLRLPGLFRDEAERFAEAFDQVFARHEPSMVITVDDDVLQRTGRPGDPSFRNIIAPDFIDRSPTLRGLRTDARVLDVVTSLLGDRHAYRASDGHLFHCDTSWHYDAYGSPLSQYTVKLSFYLDRLRGDSGAIRVIPGTHDHESHFARTLQEALYRDPSAVREHFGVGVDQLPCWTIDNEPGDVLVWSFRTIHASFHGRDGRRSLSLTFSGVGDDEQAVPAPRP